MSSGQTMPLDQARELAGTLRGLLGGACERLEIAGSIRRRRPDVHDVELVAVPTSQAEGAGLFGDMAEQVNPLELRCAELVQAGTLAPRLDKNGVARWGARYKAATFRGVAVDLFSVLSPAQWGVIFLIRTGPAAFGHKLVTPCRQGGWLPDYLRVRDGAIWHEDGSVFVTEEEQDVFNLLHREYLPPAQRTDTSVPRLAVPR